LTENFELFLSDPQCRHIYLAACTDNGFARMLEPYQAHPARKRITLVSAGALVRSIANLRLNAVEWAEVFERRRRPGPPPLTREEIIGKAVTKLVGGGSPWSKTVRRRTKFGVWAEEDPAGSSDEGDDEMVLLDAYQGID
jgi:hypothetical protein